jgi:hypothetical protein
MQSGAKIVNKCGSIFGWYSSRIAGAFIVWKSHFGLTSGDLKGWHFGDLSAAGQ